MNPIFFEDRAAHLASCQLPLIVALAGKNNIISCKYEHCTPSSYASLMVLSLVLTGVSHEKASECSFSHDSIWLTWKSTQLNVLHRAGARACLLLLWIHGITRGAMGWVFAIQRHAKIDLIIFFPDFPRDLLLRTVGWGGVLRDSLRSHWRPSYLFA